MYPLWASSEGLEDLAQTAITKRELVVRRVRYPTDFEDGSFCYNHRSSSKRQIRLYVGARGSVMPLSRLPTRSTTVAPSELFARSSLTAFLRPGQQHILHQVPI